MNTRETLNPILRARDLPPGVLKQLGILGSHEAEIVAVMRQHGGTLNIDEVIVAFYDKDGRETDRIKLGATLARMCSMGVLSRVKAGEYSVREPGRRETVAEAIAALSRECEADDIPTREECDALSQDRSEYDWAQSKEAPAAKGTKKEQEFMAMLEGAGAKFVTVEGGE